MNKKVRKLFLHRETLLRMEEVALARVAGAARLGGETEVTVCPTREYSSCCPPTGTLDS